MKQLDLKETNVAHCTGKLPMRVYDVGGVYCHWHEEYEFLIAQNDVCECIVDTVRYYLKKGECILVFPGELHTVLGEGARVNAVVFHQSAVCGSELKGLLSPAVRFRRRYGTQEGDSEITAALNEICRISKDPRTGYELLMKACIIYVIGKLYENNDFELNEKMLVKSNVFTKVLEYTEKNFFDPFLGLDKVAKETHFSRSYVSKLFRENTGSSFCEYLTSLRLSKACEMLHSTDSSVLDVSLACGFQNVSYFIQVFKKRYGMTPLVFRSNK